jgi:hypothetical protein
VKSTGAHASPEFVARGPTDTAVMASRSLHPSGPDALDRVCALDAWRENDAVIGEEMERQAPSTRRRLLAVTAVVAT